MEYELGIKDYLVEYVTMRREAMPLWQVFQSNKKLADLARINFEGALAKRGVGLSDALMLQARAEAMSDRTLTIGKFLDHSLKRNKPSRLRWGKA